MVPLACSTNTSSIMDFAEQCNYRELCHRAYRNYIAQKNNRSKMLGSTKSANNSWDKHIRHLTLFKQHNGHCRVPRHFDENPPLGRWVMNVRSHFQYLLKGKKSSLITEKRLHQLQELDFDFAPKNKSHAKFYGDRWMHHLQELHQFKAKTGHCRVPQRYSDNKKLGGWVLYVRHQYRKHQRRQPSTLNTEKIDQLLELGFEFEPQKGRPYKSNVCST